MAAYRFLRSSLKSSIPLLSRGRSAAPPDCLRGLRVQDPFVGKLGTISSSSPRLYPVIAKFSGTNTHQAFFGGKLQSSTQRRDLHTTATRALEISTEVLVQHPVVTSLAVTVSGGGMVAMLKAIRASFADQSILLLPQKPSHHLQSRKKEVQKLRTAFQSLRKQNGKDTAITVYITGMPGFGKTQLAREYGEEYYRKKVFRSTNKFVGTVDAYSISSLLRSYSELASRLGCTSALSSPAADTDELQRLELLSAAMGKELKNRPGWLLIVDNLVSDVKSVNEVQAQTGNTVPLTTAQKPFWPQPGDESWGKGYILVTTRDRKLVEEASPNVAELFLSKGMSTTDAIALLKKVSGLKGNRLTEFVIALLEKVSDRKMERAAEVVNSLERIPLSVASAGFYVSKERSRNPGYNFRDYLEGLEKGIQNESEKMLQDKNPNYPVTMTTAVSMAAKELATDPNLLKMFLLLATCAQSPVPMSLVARILGVPPDLNSAALESIRNCVLLLPSQSATKHGVDKSSLEDEIETVSLHRGTQEILRELFLGESTPPADPSTPHVDTRNDLFCHFVDGLVREFKMAWESDSVSSFKLVHLLLPHMEAHLKALNTVSGFHLDSLREVSLCSNLGRGYRLVGRRERSREVLERALRIYETSGARDDVFKATIVQTLGRTYSDLGMLKESEFKLKEALGIYKQECGEVSTEVANTLYQLSFTYERMGLHQESRKCLQRALKIYDSLFTHSNNPDDILTNMGLTWNQLGDDLKSKEMLENALAMQEQLHGPKHPKIADTLHNLGVVYTCLGQPQKSVELLQRALEINKQVLRPDHIDVALTLSALSAAYSYVGDVHKSEQFAEEALRKIEAAHGPASPGMIVALQNLGITYTNLGQPQKSVELLQRVLEIVKDTHGPDHIDVTIILCHLSQAYHHLGDVHESEQLAEEALRKIEAVHEPAHPDMVKALKHLGVVYADLGQPQKSVELLQRALEINKQVLGPDHITVAISEHIKKLCN